MKIKRLSTILIALTMTACITSCGDKDDKSSSKSKVVETPTIITEHSDSEATTEKTQSKVDKTEPTTDVDWQKLRDDYQDDVLKKTDNSISESGIIKHTNRKEEGYYLEDYITVNFTGYEHDSEVEVIVDWDKLASDLGNGITPDILEQIYGISVLNTDDKALDHSKVNDLINGDEVSIHMSENTLQSTFKQKYSKELKYIDENVWYYEDTPAIVSGLKSKSFIENANEVDKKAVNDFFEKTMITVKDSTKDFTNAIHNDYGPENIDSVLGRNSKATDKTMNCKINDYKIEKTYLATRTAASYNDSAASGLPENMIFNIYKLTVERYGSGEIFEMYYRTEVGNVLFENDKMLISEEEVKVQFAGSTDELMPDKNYWEIQEVK